MRYLLALLFLFPSLVHAQNNWVPGEVLVYLTVDADAQRIAQDVKAALPVGTVLQRMESLGKGSRYHLLHFVGSDLPPVPALERLVKQLDGVQMTSLNYLMKYRAQPNDDLYATQWSMAAIDAEEVWNFTTGGSMINGKRIAVGIVDGLVQTTHPDLADNISQASTYAGEGEEHGTLVAGVVGATGNNGIGITGVNWDVDLVPLGFGGTMAGAISGFEGALSLREDFTNSAGAEGALVVAVTVSWGFLDMSCGFGYPIFEDLGNACLLYTSPSPRDRTRSRMPSSA